MQKICTFFLWCTLIAQTSFRETVRLNVELDHIFFYKNVVINIMRMALLQRKTDVAPPPHLWAMILDGASPPLPCYYIVPETDLVIFAV